MLRKILFCFLIQYSFAQIPVWSTHLDKKGQREMDLELGPYYSLVDFIQSLTQDSIPELQDSTEDGIYSWLITHFHKPRFLLLEASVYPMPVLGTFTRTTYPNFYENAEQYNVNWVRSFTAGFPEPWAFSLFFGNLADIVHTDLSGKEKTGRGFSGFLLSWGRYHIADNILVKDHWFEGESKLKGTAIQGPLHLSWSFSIGGKLHMNPNIRDVLYFKIIRDRADLNKSGWSSFKTNSQIEFKVDLDMHNAFKLRFTRYFLLLGKKFPAQSGKWAFSFSIGVLRQTESAYSGSLNEKTNEWGLVIRPNFVF